MKKLEDGLPPLLTADQVQQLTGLKGTSVGRLAIRGVLRSIRPGGVRAVRFDREEVLEWIAAGCPIPSKKRR